MTHSQVETCSQLIGWKIKIKRRCMSCDAYHVPASGQAGDPSPWYLQGGAVRPAARLCHHWLIPAPPIAQHWPRLSPVSCLITFHHQTAWSKVRLQDRLLSPLVKLPAFSKTRRVHHRVHNSPPLVLVHALPTCFLNIDFNILHSGSVNVLKACLSRGGLLWTR